VKPVAIERAASQGARDKGAASQGAGSAPAGSEAGGIVARGLAAGRSALDGKAHPPILHDIDLTLHRGERIAIRGANGAGKTSLLLALAGLLPPRAGTVTVDGYPAHERGCRRQVASRIGLLFQNPETQLLTARVAEEIALPLANLGWPRPQILARVESVLSALGLSALAERSARTLSGGEMQRVALAAALAPEPRYLLLDEPTAHLDPESAAGVVAWIERAARDYDALVCEVTADEPVLAARRHVVIREGGIVHDGGPMDVAALEDAPSPELAAPDDLGPLRPITPGIGIAVRGISAGWTGRPHVAAEAIDLAPGKIVTLAGPSGSGKTTLLLTIAGWLPPLSGRVSVVPGAGTPGVGTLGAGTLGEAVSLIVQFPEQLFYRETVSHELADFMAPPEAGRFAMRLLGLPESLRGRSPFGLAAGEARRLALAEGLLARRPVLLFDEPAVGLDRPGRAALIHVLRLLAAAGCAVLVASHDRDLLALGDVRLRIQEGEVKPV
jgi:energy-coupling factor transport system permease/ATP-binding protein